ncbi:BTB/POZ domain-containing protein At5g66560 [Syzygium oleosum]|uniref:BTB/POZ domain-containing protein At5g66560 n=1 Tax=Syzygium oleosum TaxID=219896 RepID=UPI0024BAFF64|nr:BTB/POZ domain-containing protein At5g66560 [Syzygium oleosum]
MAAEKTSSRGQAWFCTTGLPSDIVVEVDDMTFHLHKFPLMSKSRKLHQLITEQEANPAAATQALGRRDEEGDGGGGGGGGGEGEGDGDEIEEVQQCHIALQDFPGGSETFEMAAKFCYGVKIDLSALNAAPLRCAGEFLDMTEDYSEDNLISKTERFLSQSVLKSLKDSIRALRSCDRVAAPLAESLEIPQRCVEAIVAKASAADPSLFGWPVGDGANLGRGLASQVLWNGIETNNRRKREARGNNADSWLEDLALLSLPLFKRLISAMKEADLSSEFVETCLMHYAKRYIPGVSRSSRKPALPPSSSSASSAPSESEQRELLETIIASLPPEKTASRSSGPTTTTTRFLFGLLRTAIILNASEDCRASLERKVGLQLEEATLDDLLIPSYSYLVETLYDVDCVERILGHFLDAAGADGRLERSPVLMLVGKLIDGYLSEIASDANLKPEKFYGFAISLPERARLYDDGLYRAVDVYLKAHPWISEPEREKICGLMDCQKLTLEACTHAAQNERLPLRVVVQVLFFEQLQLRHAIAGTLLAAETGAALEPGRQSESRRGDDDDDDDDDGDEEEDAEVVEQEPAGEMAVAVAVAAGQGSVSATWRSAVRENQVLRLDMDSMRTRVHQLERECSTMKKAIEKIDKDGSDDGGGGVGRANGGWRGSLTRKFGCKFKTQVCDSHEPTVVDTRKGRHRHRH